MEQKLWRCKEWHIIYIVKMQKVRQNHFGTSLKNRSSLFSCEYEFKGSTLGLAMALLWVYLKIGVGVYRTP